MAHNIGKDLAMADIRHEDLKDWGEMFRAGKLHLVCVASGGLTICDTAACSIGGMNQMDEVWPITRKVNELGETGTFWPRFPLTVLPLFKWDRSGSRICDEQDFLVRSFERVLSINRDLVKLRTMFIDCNGWGCTYNYREAVRAAESVLRDAQDIDVIYFLPDGNWYGGK